MSRQVAYRFKEPGRCRWCGEPVPRGRRSWCSQQCVDDYKVRAWGAFARRKVEARDHEVCGRCGVDCRRLHDLLRKARGHGVRRKRTRYADQAIRYRRRHPWAENRLRRLFPWLPRSGHLWEAHHRIAWVDGGDQLGLDNLMTLCVGCHRQETAALARRRATATRRAKQPELFG